MKPKVILLHNHDNSWTPADLIETDQDRRIALEALRKFDFEATDVKVYDSVAEALRPHRLDPREWIIFNWCEGYADRPWDYDGVTAELDRLGFCYTGADTRSLRLSADKARVQAVMRLNDVPIPRGRIVRPGAACQWSIFPAIVKPTNQHGSYGIDHQAVVMDVEQLRQRAAYLFETFQTPVLVEEFIDGREFQVTVWGNAPMQVLPEVEVTFGQQLTSQQRIFTYEMKFDPEGPNRHHAGFVCPAMLTPRQRNKLAQVCRHAYRALHCRDYARIDLRMSNDRMYVLDVNVNPDINYESLSVMAASVVGLSYEEVVAQITEFAAERWRATQAAAAARKGRQREQAAVVPNHA